MEEEEYIRKAGQNIKRLRIERKLTQEEFADMLNIDDSSLRRIESGRTNPTLRTLYRIAKALAVEVEDLFRNFENSD